MALEVAAWIRAPSEHTESAARQLKRQIIDKVWLFQESNGDLVGFTSIAKEKWLLEDTGESIQIIYIPYIGISTKYQGRKNPSTGKSYLR